MALESKLIESGVNPDSARALCEIDRDILKTKTQIGEDGFLSRIDKASKIYEVNINDIAELVILHPQFSSRDHTRVVKEATEVYGDEEAVKRAVIKYPSFAGSDHTRVVKEATEVYGDEEAVKRAIMKHPAFVNLDHYRVVREATEVYGDEEAVKGAIMKHPAFAGLDHSRVVKEATEVYGNEEAVKNAIMKHPATFAGLNHSRVVKEATEVYGDEEAVKGAILKYPTFAGLNHSRVLKQKSKIGKMIGLNKNEVINYLLENPVCTDYSKRRDIARIDIGKKLISEGYVLKGIGFQKMMDWHITSPYFKGTRIRVSHPERVDADADDPRLLTRMRTWLDRRGLKK